MILSAAGRKAFEDALAAENERWERIAEQVRIEFPAIYPADFDGAAARALRYRIDDLYAGLDTKGET